MGAIMLRVKRYRLLPLSPWPLAPDGFTGPLLVGGRRSTIKSNVGDSGAGVHMAAGIGSADDQAIPDVNARPIATAIPMAELEVLPNVTHYTFLARCTFFCRIVAPPLCTVPVDIDRDDIQP